MSRIKLFCYIPVLLALTGCQAIHMQNTSSQEQSVLLTVPDRHNPIRILLAPGEQKMEVIGQKGEYKTALLTAGERVALEGLQEDVRQDIEAGFGGSVDMGELYDDIMRLQDLQEKILNEPSYGCDEQIGKDEDGMIIISENEQILCSKRKTPKKEDQSE